MGDFGSLKMTFEEEFPGWTIWRSDAGRWYATRGRDLTDSQLEAGYAMTVAADDALGLREQLERQRHHERCGRP